MTSMLEKAARALPQMLGPDAFDDLPLDRKEQRELRRHGHEYDHTQADMIDLVLAVLKAIREPDEELFDTYWKVVEDHPDYTGRSEEYPLGTTVWQAMIDHITPEGREG